jgi:hypothetical protein
LHLGNPHRATVTPADARAFFAEAGFPSHDSTSTRRSSMRKGAAEIVSAALTG